MLAVVPSRTVASCVSAKTYYILAISYSIYFEKKTKFEKETYALKIKLHVRTQAPEIPGKAGAFVTTTARS
jgi:hypothetical protein